MSQNQNLKHVENPMSRYELAQELERVIPQIAEVKERMAALRQELAEAEKNYDAALADISGPGSLLNQVHNLQGPKAFALAGSYWVVRAPKRGDKFRLVPVDPPVILDLADQD